MKTIKSTLTSANRRCVVTCSELKIVLFVPGAQRVWKLRRCAKMKIIQFTYNSKHFREITHKTPSALEFTPYNLDTCAKHET